jgi:hypothetical protein
VIVQRDHFPDNTEDPEILVACGDNGWIYVSEDLAVRRNPAELKALQDAGIHAIFLHGRKRPAEWVIANLNAGRRKIVATISEASAPVHIAVMAGGRVAILNEPGVGIG